MRMIPNWKRVLTRAWSARLMILAALLSGLEVALPFLMDRFPPGIFAALSGLTVAGAFAARFVAQKGITPDATDDGTEDPDR